MPCGYAVDEVPARSEDGRLIARRCAAPIVGATCGRLIRGDIKEAAKGRPYGKADSSLLCAAGQCPALRCAFPSRESHREGASPPPRLLCRPFSSQN